MARLRVVLEAPGAAQVDDFDVLSDGGGDPLAGLLVRGGEEENLDAGTSGSLPAKGENLVNASMACCGQLRVQVFEERDASGL